jgi:hypothetical protein
LRLKILINCLKIFIRRLRYAQGIIFEFHGHSWTLPLRPVTSNK